MREASLTLITLCCGLRDRNDAYNCRYSIRRTSTFDFCGVCLCGHSVIMIYNTAYHIVQPKQSLREASRTQTTLGNERAGTSGYVSIYISFQGYHL